VSPVLATALAPLGAPFCIVIGWPAKGALRAVTIIATGTVVEVAAGILTKGQIDFGFGAIVGPELKVLKHRVYWPDALLIAPIALKPLCTGWLP